MRAETTPSYQDAFNKGADQRIQGQGYRNPYRQDNNDSAHKGYKAGWVHAHLFWGLDNPLARKLPPVWFGDGLTVSGKDTDESVTERTISASINGY